MAAKSLRERIVDRVASTLGINISGMVREEAARLVEERVAELETELVYALEELQDLKEPGWRLLGDTGHQKDYTWEDYEQVIKEAWAAFVLNPYAKRQIRYGAAFLVGRGFSVRGATEEIQEIIDEFVDDPKNKWELKRREIANRFMIEGDCFVILYVNTLNGSVIIRDVESLEIKDVIVDENDPDQLVALHRVYTKRRYDFQQRQWIEEEVEDIIRVGERDPRNDNVIRDVVHFKIPTVSTRQRGLSELNSHLYWLKMYKKLMDARVILNIIRSSLVWDVSVEGSPDDVEREAQKNKKPPKPGTVKVHSTAVEWNAKTPNIGASDARDDIRAIRAMIVAGSGQPEHIVTGDESGSSHGTSTTAMRSFHAATWDMQDIFGYFLTVLFHKVIEYKQRFGGAPKQFYYDKESDDPKDEDEEKRPIPRSKWIQIIFPEPEAEDSLRQARALQIDEIMGWASKETVATRRGYDYARERQRIERELNQGAPGHIPQLWVPRLNPGATPPGISMPGLQGDSSPAVPRTGSGGSVPSGDGRTNATNPTGRGQ